MDNNCIEFSLILFFLNIVVNSSILSLISDKSWSIFISKNNCVLLLPNDSGGLYNVTKYKLLALINTVVCRYDNPLS